MIRSAFRCLPLVARHQCLLGRHPRAVAVARGHRPARRDALAHDRPASRQPHAKPWTASPASRTRSSWASSTAACGRRPMPAARGCRSSTTSRRARSARLPWRRLVPSVIYVGTGEGQQRPDLATGDGMYKSIERRPDVDASRASRHAADRPHRRRSAEPRSAVRGGARPPYGPNAERGIFRSLDGGQTFQKVLYKDENTGGSDVAIDPEGSQHRVRRALGSAAGPVGERRFPRAGQRPLQVHRRRHDVAAADQRPADVGRRSPGPHRHHVAPSMPSRLFATVEARSTAGIYRSDDSGESWYRVNSDQRVVARPNDACEVRVHPTNPDIVYVPTIVAWKSTDGGKTFTAFRGAPGGDDYQKIWINPTMPDVMIMTSDQGAVVTLNGGSSWSSWYNQPTARVLSRDHRQRLPVPRVQRPAGERLGLHFQPRRRRPDHVPRVASGRRRGIRLCRARSARSRHRLRRQGVAIRSADRAGAEHHAQTASHRRLPRRADDAGAVLAGQPAQALLRLERPLADDDRRRELGSDQPRSHAEGRGTVPANVGKYIGSEAARPSQRGVIYTIAPSYRDENTIWAGTDDGLIHVTRDGGKIVDATSRRRSSRRGRRCR